jgi:hypothetical protein
MKNRLMPHCDANKRTITPPKTIESDSYSTILTVIITYYYCYAIIAIRITQGETAGAVSFFPQKYQKRMAKTYTFWHISKKEPILILQHRFLL